MIAEINKNWIFFAVYFLHMLSWTTRGFFRSEDLITELFDWREICNLAELKIFLRNSTNCWLLKLFGLVIFFVKHIVWTFGAVALWQNYLNSKTIILSFCEKIFEVVHGFYEFIIQNLGQVRKSTWYSSILHYFLHAIFRVKYKRNKNGVKCTT